MKNLIICSSKRSLSRAKALQGDVLFAYRRHDENYGGYVINHLLPIEVTIASPKAVDYRF
jgi:hypothetical protein